MEKRNLLERPNYEVKDERLTKPVTWSVKTQLRLLQGDDSSFVSEDEQIENMKEKIWKQESEIRDYFDEEGNPVKKIPDVKKFNLVFDNSEYKLS